MCSNKLHLKYKKAKKKIAQSHKNKLMRKLFYYFFNYLKKLFFNNRLCEKPQFDIVNGYTEVLYYMYFTAFYAPVIPIGSVLSLGTLTFLYVMFKVMIYYKLIFFKKYL